MGCTCQGQKGCHYIKEPVVLEKPVSLTFEFRSYHITVEPMKAYQIFWIKFSDQIFSAAITEQWFIYKIGCTCAQIFAHIQA